MPPAPQWPPLTPARDDATFIAMHGGNGVGAADMDIHETSLSVADLSRTRSGYARIDVAKTRHGRLHEVLAVTLSGPCGVGADGHRDARVLYAAIVWGWLLWPSDALLLDVTGLDYVWGDDLIAVLDIGSDRMLAPSPVPVAILCAEWNRSAFDGLIAGIGDPVPFVTTDRRMALARLVEELLSR